MATILDDILARKQAEVAERKAALGKGAAGERQASACRGFERALRAKLAGGEAGVIAEIKKASPSQGVIRADFAPEAIAASYAAGGAACLSVLTDHDYFQGSEDNLVVARQACDLPVLRKDFIVDEWQIQESYGIGADCILLIVAALSPEQVADYQAQAVELGMDVLIEVHDAAELEIALATGNSLIGINNRDLHRFETRLETTLELAGQMPSASLVVTESGIHQRADVERLRAEGIECFLVGEALMRAADPGTALRQLFER